LLKISNLAKQLVASVLFGAFFQVSAETGMAGILSEQTTPASAALLTGRASGVEVTPESGMDLGVQVNAAILALPLMPVLSMKERMQHCGVVRIPTGKYSFSTTIIKPNCVTIEGNGAQIVYLGKTMAIAEAGFLSDSYANVTGGINNLWLQGPGSHLGAGFGDTTGLLIGGDPSGVVVPSDYGAYAQLNQNLHIEGFHTGIMLGGFSSLNSQMGGEISNNYQGIWAPNNTVGAGEQFDLYAVVINNNYQTGILNDIGYEIKQYGGSIDYTGGVPGQPFYAGNKFALSGTNVAYEGHGVHFEQDSGPIINMVGNSSILSLFGGTVYESARPGSSKAFLQVFGLNNEIVLDGVDFQADHPMAELIDWNGTGTAGSLTIHGSAGNYAHATPVVGNTKSIATWDVVEGNTHFGANGVTSQVTTLGIVQGQTGVGIVQGGVTWTDGSGPPPLSAGACVTGSLYSNLDGSSGKSLYVCENKKWVGK
jgi:hypothetical protein